MPTPITVGAVIYDPKVTLIWEIIGEFFEEQGCPIKPLFYSSYELQVSALLAKEVDIAWNSPLAWVDAQLRSGGTCRAIAMRDTDRDRVTHLVVRRGGPVASPGDLRGRKVACGALDSPQATLLPLHHLRQHELLPDRDFSVLRHDVLVGKHGDHIGGEVDAFRALQRGAVDVTAVLDLNWSAWQADGTADPHQFAVLSTTAPFDHCNFTVLDAFPADEERRWTHVLFEMKYSNPAHREMMDMEGLKAWLPGRTTGYAALEQAVDEQQFFAGTR